MIRVKENELLIRDAKQVRVGESRVVTPSPEISQERVGVNVYPEEDEIEKQINELRGVVVSNSRRRAV